MFDDINELITQVYDINVLYNGSTEEYEDPADYIRQPPIKAVVLG